MKLRLACSAGVTQRSDCMLGAVKEQERLTTGKGGRSVVVGIVASPLKFVNPAGGA